MLDVRRLALLRELSLRGTIAAVAAALHQTSSSVSQQLALLEREAGVPLLRKSGRRVQLTPQAEILVEDARHGVVVVLPGVDEHDLRIDRLERVDYGLDLHEVRPRSGDTDGSHG